MKQKSIVLTAVILGLVAGCAGTPAPGAPPEVTPAGQPPAGLAPEIVLSTENIVTRDLGHAGGPSVSVNLYAPIEDALVTKNYRLQTVGSCWALTDIFLYQVTLRNAGTGETLTTFDVNCKSGRAKAVLQHLKPGIKYSITIVAKGNKGGTAAETVLNAKTPSVGYFDLTHVDPLLEGQEVTAAIQVELDCEGAGYYERSGKIDIIPVVKGGGQVTYEAESGKGECYVCGDYPIYAGTTTYDSMFHAGTNGDVFNTNEHHNHWTNEINGWGWVQRDFPYAYNVSEISIGEAFNDKSKGTLTEAYVKLRNATTGEWEAVDTILNSNISNYKKKLAAPFAATGFRLELKSANGWVSASAITLKADVGVACPPSGSPAPTPAPSTGVTPPPSAAPTATPTLPPCDPPATPTPLPSTPATPAPSPSATKTPTPAPTATPTAAPTATPTPALACAGPFESYTQGGWGNGAAGTNPGSFRDANWAAMTGGTLKVGVGKVLTFTSSAAVEAFLPSGGTSVSLAASLTNPVTDVAGVFGGQIVALKLNVLRSDAGLNPAGAVGKLRNVKYGSGKFAGYTIGQVLAIAEAVLGGDLTGLPAGCTIVDLADACAAVNEGFEPAKVPNGTTFKCN